MAKLKIPAAPVIRETKYEKLKGADFSRDSSVIDGNRSPAPLNLISDRGGNPVKRPGWRTLTTVAGPVHNIWSVNIDGTRHIVVHGGTNIYELAGNVATVLRSGVTSSKGTAFSMRAGDRTCLYILTGAEYLVFDGDRVSDVGDSAKIPTVLISRFPSGGGVVYEAVNLLQKKRTVGFLGNSTDLVYYLPDTDVLSVDEVLVMDASGGFVPATDYSVNLSAGTVSFSSAKPPVVSGQDNVKITYSDEDGGYFDRIAKCTVSGIYGLNAQNRVFLSGNPDYVAYDWYSDIYDPTYFPDTSYSIIGTGDTAVMGYLKLGEYMAVVKEDNAQDTTVFLRYGELVDGEISFKIRQGIVGVGAVSKHCFVNLSDEPMFLAREGVHAITSTLLSYERVVKNRSYFVDRKLTEEKNLKDATACEWDGYYLLAVNGNCYVFDSRQKSGATSGNSDFVYEAYYWEGVPAVCFLVLDDTIYFGTDLGGICRFNDDIDNLGKYADDAEYAEDGTGALVYAGGGRAIVAQWATPNDDDDIIHFFKTLHKKGSLVVLHPFDRSSGKVFFLVDGRAEQFVRDGYLDIFNWEDIDFERFSFDSSTGPREIYFRKKQKKYKRILFVIRNDAICEAFGILEIVKSYTVGNYSKNRG
jgi:hypothetical protein